MSNQEIMLNMMKKNEYMQFLGIEMQELRKGYGLGKIPFRKGLENPYGMLHGGSLYSLADIVAGATACMNGYFVTTVNGNMNFMLPAVNTEYVYCEAKEVRQGEHLAVYDICLTADDGRILDNGSFTFYVAELKI